MHLLFPGNLKSLTIDPIKARRVNKRKKLSKLFADMSRAAGLEGRTQFSLNGEYHEFISLLSRIGYVILSDDMGSHTVSWAHAESEPIIEE